MTMRSTFEDEDAEGFEMRPLSSCQDEVEPSSSNHVHEKEVTGISTPHQRARALSTASAQTFELYTPDEERAVLRKLDTHVVLFMSFLYLLSFLDRSSKLNISLGLPSSANTHRHRQREDCWLVQGSEYRRPPI